MAAGVAMAAGVRRYARAGIYQLCTIIGPITEELYDEYA